MSNVHIDSLVILNIQPQALADMHKIRETFPAILSKHQSNQGFRIALDEAGTSYTCLQTLLYLNSEYINIDKSLILSIEKLIAKQHPVELIIEYTSKSNANINSERMGLYQTH